MKRNFFRRAFSFLIDLFIVSIVLSLFAFSLNSILGTNLVAPHLFKSTICQQGEFFSPQGLTELFPVEEDAQHFQFECEITTMFLTKYRTLNFGTVQEVGNTTVRRSVSFVADTDNNKIDLASLDFALFLFSPALFAFLLSRNGHTPGKKMMSVIVRTADGNNPGFWTAMKREYLKALFLVLGRLSSLVDIVYSGSQSVEELAQSVSSAELPGANFWTNVSVSAILLLLIIWFQFGSFIRWKGQTYWDRWNGLVTQQKTSV